MKGSAIEQVKRIGRPVKVRTRQIRRFAYRSRGVHQGLSANDVIYHKMAAGPFAAGKIGESELRAMRFFRKFRDSDAGCTDIRRASRRIFINAGVFPETVEAFNAACRELLEAIEQLDVIAVWYNAGEPAIVNRVAPDAELVSFEGLQRPYVSKRPWARVLEGRRVLVVGPFSKSVEQQHTHLRDIWRESPLMPKEFELETLTTPVSASLAISPYPSWMEGLKQLRDQMTLKNFDVALVGAGAWSLPLAAHAKSLGCGGIHLGGDTQVLFGIRGRRWDNESRVRPWFNETWVRPLPEETPKTKQMIENGCYW